MTWQHSTSISVCGETRAILAGLTGRDRGIYVSHLIEHRELAPVVDLKAERREVDVLRLRLSDLAHERLHAWSSIATASRFVDAIVREAWATSTEIARRLVAKIEPEQILLVFRLVATLRPTVPDGVYAAALFGKVEPTWAVTYATTKALVDSRTAGLFLALGAVVPPAVEPVLASAVELAVRERTMRPASDPIIPATGAG